jgi:transposase
MVVEKQTEMILAYELSEAGLSKSAIARRLGRDRETIRLWLRGIQQHGLKVYLSQSQQACKKPRPARQIDVQVKRWIWSIREREHDCCGQKIAYFLKQEHDITVSVPKIYEVLAEKYVIRSKWKKNHSRGAVPEAHAPRQVVQMDTIDFGGLFAFTAIDIWSREADVLLRPSLTAQDGLVFLQVCMRRRFNRFVNVIQTDGGSEFEAIFAQQIWCYCDQHRIARPYKKNEQSFIESFNRTVRKECLGWAKYKAEDVRRLTPCVEAFLKRYHYHRPHLAFEPMRPPLKNKLDTI